MDEPLLLDELLQKVLSIKETRQQRREGWSLLICGRMGVGKSELLDSLAQYCSLSRRPSQSELKARMGSDQALISVLPGTPEERVHLLSHCGLNTVPSWLTPFRLLSGGEQARVLTALQLAQGAQILDDFGACLDEQSANTAALAARRMLPAERAAIFASQTPRLARFFQPDFVIWISERRESSGGREALLRQRRFYLIKNPNAHGDCRPSVSVTLDASGALDVAPRHRPYAAIRGGGEAMAAGPLRALRTNVRCDDATAYVSQCTSLAFTGTIEKQFIELPISHLGNWSLGCIMGPSGSGKSVTLRRMPRLSTLPDAAWRGRSVIEVLGNDSLARQRARGAGLQHEQWSRPYAELSAGERAAACFAYALKPFDDPDAAACIVTVDEAFSYHDAAAARVCAHKLRVFIQNAKQRGARTQLVLAGAAIDADLVAVLQPDWVFNPSNTASDALRIFRQKADQPADAVDAPPDVVQPPLPDALFRRYTFSGTARNGNHLEWRKLWDSVKAYHYLSEQFPTNAACNIYLLRCDVSGELVGFIAFGKYFGKASTVDPRPLYQERRLVIVPWWQGLGIGPKLSEALAAYIVAGGASSGAQARYSSVTANAGLGAQRSRPGSLWKASLINGKLSAGSAYGSKDKPRYIQYSHEFIGPGARAGIASASAGGAAASGGRASAAAAPRLQGSPGGGGARGGAAPAGWRAAPSPPPAARPLSSAGGASGSWHLPPRPPPPSGVLGLKREREASPAPAAGAAGGISIRSLFDQLDNKPRLGSGSGRAATLPPGAARGHVAAPQDDEVIVIDGDHDVIVLDSDDIIDIDGAAEVVLVDENDDDCIVID